MSNHHQRPTVEDVNIALTRAFGRPRTLLDVGCGPGLNGAVARSTTRGEAPRVVGIEDNPSYVESARRVLSDVIAVDPANLSEVDKALKGQKFDCIVFPDLLERVADPTAIVRHYSQYLTREGHMIASFRNAAAWSAKNRTNGDRASHFQTRDSAGEILERAGLQVLRIDENPVLAHSLRNAFAKGHGEGAPENAAHKAYMTLVRPLEMAVTRAAPKTLSFQHIVVAREKPKPGPISLTVGMLTMDEEDSIEPMVKEIRKYAPDAKLLCIDSSRKDQTPVIAERLGVRVIRQLPPRGHGPAMELLMYESAKDTDALIYLDCDFTYPPHYIPAIRKMLESGTDVVNGSRTRRKPKAMPLPNYLANKSFVLCSQIMHGIPASDLHSGLRGYRASTIRAFSFDGEGDALPIDTLLWPARCGYDVVEVPIDYRDRVGDSKLRKLAGVTWTFIRLAKTYGIGERRTGKDKYEMRERVE